jgi:hypothetical protein
MWIEYKTGLKVRADRSGRVATPRSLAVIIPAGFYSKFYHGPAAHRVNNSLDGIF